MTKALPPGTDETISASEIRVGMWVIDPESGEWPNVKQSGRGNACTGFGGQKTWVVSLRRFGHRELSVDAPVTVRRPAGGDA